MRITTYWHRNALLPCGSEVEVEYKLTAEVTEDEHEILTVAHVSGFRSGKEWLAALDVDEFDAALSSNDRKRLEKLLTAEACEESASRKHDRSIMAGEEMMETHDGNAACPSDTDNAEAIERAR